MTKKKSNGTVAGNPSMGTLSSFGFINTQFDVIDRLASTHPESFQSFLDAYILGFSKVLTLPLAAQTIDRVALSVQRRVATVITELPKAALWCLVAANLLFSALTLILTVLALIATSPSVHQVQTRLGVAGLVAQLFETRNSAHEIDSDTDLFKIPGHEKTSGEITPKVGVRRTDTGGSIFTVVSNEADAYTERRAPPSRN